MKTLLFILLIPVFFDNCGFIARKGYGAKKQQVENKRSITAWLNKNGFDTVNVVSVNPEYYYEIFSGLPQAPLLFDRQTGNFLAIGFTNGEYCPKDVDKSFSAVMPYHMMNQKSDSLLIATKIIIPPGGSIKDTSTHKKIKDTLKLNLYTFGEKLSHLNGEALKNISEPGDDYTLILPFGLFLRNRLQVKDMKTFYLSARTNRFANIRIVFVNLDKQEWWGEEWNKKINIRY